MLRRPAATLAAAAAVSVGVLAAGVALGLPLFSLDRYASTLFNLGSCFPLARGFEFVLGMATCLVWRRWLQPAPFSLAAWTAIEAAALAGAVVWLVACVPWLVGDAEGPAFAWIRPSGSCWLFALTIAALAGGRGLVGRALALRPLVRFGEASFAFYLVHMIVMRALRFHFGPGPGALSALALALALAFLLHEAVEKPMRRRLLALGSAREAGARAAAAAARAG